MFKKIVTASIVAAVAIVSTALALTPHTLDYPTRAAPRAQVDPLVLTLQAGPLPRLEVDRAF